MTDCQTCEGRGWVYGTIGASKVRQECRECYPWCPRCGGHGDLGEDGDYETCTTCDGDGSVPRETLDGEAA